MMENDQNVHTSRQWHHEENQFKMKRWSKTIKVHKDDVDKTFDDEEDDDLINSEQVNGDVVVISAACSKYPAPLD